MSQTLLKPIRYSGGMIGNSLKHKSNVSTLFNNGTSSHSNRTIVTVSNHTDGQQANIPTGLFPMNLYHTPSGENLPSGKLEPREKGTGQSGTPAKYQPEAFGGGGPQVTANREGSTVYGGAFKSPDQLTQYELHGNDKAQEAVATAIATQKSNDLVNFDATAWHNNRVLNPNQHAYYGNDRSALQPTTKAFFDPDAHFHYGQVSSPALQKIIEDIKAKAKNLKSEDGKFKNLNTTGGKTLTDEMNETMKNARNQI